MDRDAARQALDEASRSAASIRLELDDDYLRLIALVENDPANKAGTDKSWVLRASTVTRPKPPDGR